MKTPEFAEAYTRHQPSMRLERAYPQGLSFDKRMGDMTLALLELEGPDRDLPTEQNTLNTQLHAEFAHRAAKTPVAAELAATDKTEVFGPDLTEEAALSVTLQYSALQYEGFVAGWEEMIFGGEYSPEARRESLRRGQLFLAQHAIQLAAVRHPMTIKSSDFAFFSPEMYWARRTMNGILNEYDTAIALMSLSIADEDLVVVNAPNRFEQNHSNRSADFLAYHRGSDQVIGIQTKSNGGHAPAAELDVRRIMTINGARDLKGVIGTRTWTKSSDPQDVIWPGLLSAEILSTLKLYGPDADIKGDFDLTTALYYKQLAATCRTHPMDRRRKINGSVADAREAVAGELYERLGAERPRRQQPERRTNGRVKRKPAKRRR